MYSLETHPHSGQVQMIVLSPYSSTTISFFISVLQFGQHISCPLKGRGPGDPLPHNYDTTSVPATGTGSQPQEYPCSPYPTHSQGTFRRHQAGSHPGTDRQLLA